MIQEIQEALLKIREEKPLILNLTNYVTMDLMANSLLALGAAPIMSVCDEELEALVKISHSLNVNIGTLDAAFIKRCHKAAQLAKTYHKPVILDPVGAGSSFIRTEAAKNFMPYVDIIKGNASEIMALEQIEVKTLGVESTKSADEAKDHAKNLAKRYDCTVVVSGFLDFITEETKEMELKVGSPLMSRVTGMGCALTAVIAVFKSISTDSFRSAELAVTYFGLCGNVAAQKTQGAGSFRSAFIDELYAPDFNEMGKFYAE